MALDGIFLRHIADEIMTEAQGAKITQVHQPNRDELILSLHTQSGNKRLLISTRADSPRVGFTKYAVENPAAPPMFCMLLRKRLVGARITNIRQHGLERVLFIDLDASTTIGDRTKLTLIVEIMGKYSNCILADEGVIIIDALKRVDLTLSSKRLVLPALVYDMPPEQGKTSLMKMSAMALAEIVLQSDKPTLDKAILSCILGMSPLVCREAAFRAAGECDAKMSELTGKQKSGLCTELDRLKTLAESIKGTPVLLRESSGKPIDFSFTEITQYENAVEISHPDSFSELLDSYYHERDSRERMRVRSRELSRFVTNHIARVSKKLNLQYAQLKECADRENLRVRGDLLQANLHMIKKGDLFVDVANYYEESQPTVRIPLDPAKTPAQNAQKYYRDYARAKTAQRVLGEQTQLGQEELLYLESVAHEIDSAASESDLSAVREELCVQGYIKAPKGKRKPPAIKPPHEFQTSDGFKVLVGRNNRQNDILTMKTAAKNDVWLHTKNIPGSHTVIITEGRDPGETAIYEAAQLCAWFSAARESAQVPVDYTLARYVSKPQGAPPGRVIYTNQRTLFVKPEEPKA